VIAAALGVVAVLVVVGVLVFWDDPDTPARRWLLLAGIPVLPGLALLVGASRVMDDAKHPEFCGSCHVMGPFIRDLQDPASTNLAALHYQNRWILRDQCYTCHTDYGLTGPLQAKLDGVRHLLHYELGTYRLPIRLRREYNTANCLHCHAESKAFLGSHDVDPATLGPGEPACLDCHAPAHPEPATRAAAGATP